MNPGFSTDVVKLLSLMKQDDIHDNYISDLFENALSPRFQKNNPFIPNGLLTNLERKELLDKWKDSNKKLKKYCPGETAEFFFSEIDSTQKNNHEKRDRRDQILMELIIYLNRRIDKLERNQPIQLLKRVLRKLISKSKFW